MKQLGMTMRAYMVVVIIFLLLTIVLPANRAVMQQYGLSAKAYHLLVFAVVLPQTVLWAAAFYGYAQLKRYADAIRRTRDGESFKQIAQGARWLAWGLVIPSIVATILDALVNSHGGFRPSAVIIDNYIALTVPVVAFTLMSNGSRNLSGHAQLRVSNQAIKCIIAVFVAFGVLYCYLTFRQLNLRSATATDNSFYLPTWLLVVSITIPYLYAWFTGLIAASDIALVGRHTPGILYRKSLRVFALGIVLVLAGSITLQYVTSVQPRTLHVSLNGMLVTTYAIRFIAGIGYIVIAHGANRLRKIEEV